MAWEIRLSEKAKKTLASLDKIAAHRIEKFLWSRLAEHPAPAAIAEPLEGSELGAFMRWRVGDYRIIGKIEDDIFLILVVKIGHRREIYR